MYSCQKLHTACVTLMLRIGVGSPMTRQIALFGEGFSYKHIAFSYHDIGNRSISVDWAIMHYHREHS